VEFLTVSRDGGTTWTKAEATGLRKPYFTLAVDHQNINKVYAGTLYGMFVSEDYGETFQAMPSLIDEPVVVIVDDPKTDGILYISVNKKGVLKSTDNGETWTDFNNGLPDPVEDIVLLMEINPKNPEEIYAVTRKDFIFAHDGESWQK